MRLPGRRGRGFEPVVVRYIFSEKYSMLSDLFFYINDETIFIVKQCRKKLFQKDAIYFLKGQAETGPSRRHIYGSKLAKGLQNAKVLVNWGPFMRKKFEKKSHNAEKI